MLNKCLKCKKKIELKWFLKKRLKNRYVVECPHCKTPHKATKLSIVANALVFGCVFVYLIAIKQFWFNILWIVAFTFLLEPFILRYQLEGKKVADKSKPYAK